MSYYLIFFISTKFLFFFQVSFSNLKNLKNLQFFEPMTKKIGHAIIKLRWVTFSKIMSDIVFAKSMQISDILTMNIWYWKIDIWYFDCNIRYNAKYQIFCNKNIRYRPYIFNSHIIRSFIGKKNYVFNGKTNTQLYQNTIWQGITLQSNHHNLKFSKQNKQ